VLKSKVSYLLGNGNVVIYPIIFRIFKVTILLFGIIFMEFMGNLVFPYLAEEQY